MLCRLIGSPKRVLPFFDGERMVKGAALQATAQQAELVAIELASGALTVVHRDELNAYATQVPAWRLSDLPLVRVRWVESTATLAEVSELLERDPKLPAVAMREGGRLIAIVTRLADTLQMTHVAREPLRRAA